ncbi:MBL fold metallo-hydrolase [archaeon]|nr:MAG: MBL fold metallo-hydrolase [archaeon]
MLGCAETREAVIIDPVFEKADRDTHLAHDLGLTLKYSINTHVHADHVSGSTALRTRNPGLKSVVAEVSKGKSDMYVNEGDVLSFGKRHLRCLSTSGHTDGCMSFVLDDETMVFTGDALFVRGCGRTDFQQGNPAALYDNIHGKIFTLPEACVVYPGHDYNGHLRSTVGEEKRFNPRLNKVRTALRSVSVSATRSLHACAGLGCMTIACRRCVSLCRVVRSSSTS